MAKYLSSISSDTMKFNNVFSVKNKNVVIKFDEIFGNPDFKAYNVFVMGVGKKRVYAMGADAMCKDNNKILSINPEISQRFIASYFSVKKAIDDGIFTKLGSDKDLEKYGVESRRDFGK